VLLENQIKEISGNAELNDFRKELEKELEDILSFWMKYTPDPEHGGFYGKIDHQNQVDETADKGLVLNARILWSFATAYSFNGRKEYLEMANRSYRYILEHFADPAFGGVYWSVDYKGEMKDGKKQIYGLAFCIYAMASYYQATGDQQALHFAKDLFEYIEKYSFDNIKGGYLEAFTRGWELIEDLRLSEKDANEKKTMNTHLHIIEAYAALYRVCQNDRLKDRIIHLLTIFHDHIINKENWHLHLFMDEDWNVRSNGISFGHDIEAAWLLLECAEISGDAAWIGKYKEIAVKISDAAMEGMDKDGGLWHEFDPVADHWTKEKHSWPQAEAMVAFMQLYLMRRDDKYLKRSITSWHFIKDHIKDTKNGEWFWGVYADYSIMKTEDKIGFWKCPYHSTRACIEVIKRIDLMNN